MIKQFLLIITLSLITGYLTYSATDSIFSLSLQIPAYSGQNIDVGYTYGSKILLKDQIKLNSHGYSQYSGIEHEGIYFIRLADSTSFEFMITQPGYYVVQINDGKMNIEGNAACEAYHRYIHSISVKLHLIDSLKNISHKTIDPVLLIILRKKIEEYQSAIDSMTSDLAEKYCGSFLGNYAKALLPIDVSLVDISQNRMVSDSGNILNKLWLYRKHYFDNTDFNDPRLIYTPVLEDKIISYLDRMVYNSPDSICTAIDIILTRSQDTEVTRFLATLLLERYCKLKHLEPGEKVYVYLVNHFFLAGKAPWLSDSDIRLLTEEAQKMQAVLSGTVVPEIVLTDASGRECSLLAIQKEITILVFWDFQCPTCKRIIQDLINLTEKKYFLDLQVYTIYTGKEIDIWKAWNYKKLPGTWINTIQNPENPVSVQFNISHIPSLFILDKNKVIVRKNITVPQLESYLSEYMK